MITPLLLPAPFSFFLLQAFIFAVSLVTALLEIQIEGEHGWAQKLPTWRYAPAWFKFLGNGKELTGYHLSLHTLLLLFIHFPVLFIGWSWLFEFTILSCYFSYILFWDFLWFICNPAYGIHCFRKGHVWWYQGWWGRFPVDYYLAFITSGVLAFLRGVSPGALADPRLGGVPVPLQHAFVWFLSMTAFAFPLGAIAYAVTAYRVRTCPPGGIAPIGPIPPAPGPGPIGSLPGR